MRIVVSFLVAVGAMYALAGGCSTIGIPPEWCGVSGMTIWALGLSALTGMWASNGA